MTYSIEFQMLSKDAASKITIQVSKTSVMSFQFKNVVLKINYTESKMPDMKNLSLVETEQLAEVVLMKKVKRNIKIRRCVGQMYGESYREIKLCRKWCFQTFLS